MELQINIDITSIYNKIDKKIRDDGVYLTTNTEDGVLTPFIQSLLKLLPDSLALFRNILELFGRSIYHPQKNSYSFNTIYQIYKASSWYQKRKKEFNLSEKILKLLITLKNRKLIVLSNLSGNSNSGLKNCFKIRIHLPLVVRENKEFLTYLIKKQLYPVAFEKQKKLRKIRILKLIKNNKLVGTTKQELIWNTHLKDKVIKGILTNLLRNKEIFSYKVDSGRELYIVNSENTQAYNQNKKSHKRLKCNKPSAQDILRILMKTPGSLTTFEIQQKSNFSTTSIHSILKILVVEGLIEKFPNLNGKFKSRYQYQLIMKNPTP